MLTIYFVIILTSITLYLFYKGFNGLKNKCFKLMIYPNKIKEIRNNYFSISILFIIMGTVVSVLEITILILKLLGKIHFK